MTQYVRHMANAKTGPIFMVSTDDAYAWRGSGVLTPKGYQYVLPKSEYRLCTVEGEWVPEWNNVTLECQLSMNENGACSIWHRSARMRSATDILHPCHASRYRVTVDPARGSICIEERA